MSFNTRSPAVKRLMKEAQELKTETELYRAQPLEDNIFEWHFTIRGPSDSDFAGGIYHGRILLPADYPMKPPSITFLTPNGRFKTNEKICLSISGHHPETWQPSWSIRTALLALIGFMPTFGEGALGSLDYTAEERKILAKKSLSFKCSTCNTECATALLDLTDKSQSISEEAKQLASQIDFKNNNKQTTSTSESTTTQETSSNNVQQESSTSAATTPASPPPATSERARSESRTDTSSLSRSQSRNSSSSSPTSNSSIFLIILCVIFLLLLLRRLFIAFSGEKTDFSMYNKEL